MDSTIHKEVEHVYLVENNLVGCQSHANTKLLFKPGLNVIVARNNTGKSVFFKMLMIAASPNCFTREEKKALISRGSEYALSRYVFSDGSSCIVQVYPNKVLYFYTDDYKNTQYEVSLYPHPESIRKLGLIVDPKEGFIANMLDQDQALLLVKSSSSTNNNLVKMLTSHEPLDNLIELLRAKEIEYKEDLKEVNNILYPIELRLSQLTFIDLSNLREDIEDIEAAINILDTLSFISQELEVLEAYTSKPKVDCDFLLKALDVAVLIQDDCRTLKYIKPVEQDLDLIDLVSKVVECYPDTLYVDSSVDDILDLAEEFLSLGDEAMSLTVIKDTEEDMRVLESIDTINEMLEGMKLAIFYEKSIAEREDKIEDLEQFVSKLGREVECPIYGKIIHAYDHCVPVGN